MLVLMIVSPTSPGENVQPRQMRYFLHKNIEIKELYRPLEIRDIYQYNWDIFLDVFISPSTKSAMNNFPMPIFRWQVSPGSLCA